MDYWKQLDVHFHQNWEAFKQSDFGPKRLWLFSTKATNEHWNVSFEDGDGLVFGNEGHGAPGFVHEDVGDDFRVTLPMKNPELRSHNLATSVGIATYEALRQLR